MANYDIDIFMPIFDARSSYRSEGSMACFLLCFLFFLLERQYINSQGYLPKDARLGNPRNVWMAHSVETAHPIPLRLTTDFVIPSNY